MLVSDERDQLYADAAGQDPALRWCAPDPALRRALWETLESAREAFGQRRLELLAEQGEWLGRAWLTDADDGVDEQAVERLIETLSDRFGEALVDLYLTYAEASDSMTPEQECLTVSGVYAPTERAAKELVLRCGEGAAAQGRAGAWIDTADAELAQRLLAAGAVSGGQVWMGELSIYGLWIPAVA